MRKITRGLVLIFFLWGVAREGCHVAEQSIVVSLRGPGRFGDSVMSFAKSQYIAWKNALPFFYTPFNGAENLMLSRRCKSARVLDLSRWKYKLKVKDLGLIDPNRPDIVWQGNMYSHVPGYANLQQTHESHLENTLLQALDQPEYGRMVRQLLQPISTRPHVLTEDPLVIGVHYRAGSGPDQGLGSEQHYEKEGGYIYHFYLHPTTGSEGTRGEDHGKPTKFPPLQYYLDQLVWICKHLQSKPTILLCTDHRNPQSLCKHIEMFLQKHKAPFGSVAAPRGSMVQDVCTLSVCDILIRGNSNFARAAQLMGEHTIIIRPYRYAWHGKKLQIDEVAVDVRKDGTLLAKLFKHCVRGYPLPLTK